MRETMTTKAELRQRAKTANKCIDWWDVCKAECCRQFTLRGVSPYIQQKGTTLSLHVNLSPDLQRYWRLHGAKVAHGMVHIDCTKYKIICNPKQDKLTFYRDCDALDGLKCKYHGTDKKPKICSDWNVNKPETITKGGNITDNCLAKYKQPTEGENDKYE